MQKRGLSQEGLKLIACITMLVDHIGAVFFPFTAWFRIIGRIAFPIYCFMLAEGVYHTKNPRKYGLRLLIGALLSEALYDCTFYGGFNWHHQSVMLALLIGFIMGLCIKYTKQPILQMLIVVPFALVAEWAGVDYGGLGVVTMAFFMLTRDLPNKLWLQVVALAALSYITSNATMLFAGIAVRIQLFAVLAMIPIAFYTGRKLTNNKAVQLGFYLFYPVHIAILFLLLKFVFVRVYW